MIYAGLISNGLTMRQKPLKLKLFLGIHIYILLYMYIYMCMYYEYIHDTSPFKVDLLCGVEGPFERSPPLEREPCYV